jgi:Protein of unknown function (DUF4230)
MFKLALKIFFLFSLLVILVIIGISSGVINISKIENNNRSGLNGFLSGIDSVGYYKLITFNLNYAVTDTTANDSSGINKFHSKGKVLAIINGNVDACINLKRIDKSNIKENDDTAYVTLPMPVLCNAEINYEQSKIYDINFYSKVLDQNSVDKLYPAAMNNLKAEAIRMGILDQAKINAKKILQPVIKEMLKKNIILKFEED